MTTHTPEQITVSRASPKSCCYENKKVLCYARYLFCFQNPYLDDDDNSSQKACADDEENTKHYLTFAVPVVLTAQTTNARANRVLQYYLRTKQENVAVNRLVKVTPSGREFKKNYSQQYGVEVLLAFVGRHKELLVR